MKAIKKVLAITALGTFALVTPALAGYGGGSNAMTNITSDVACANTQPAPHFVFNSIYGGENGGATSGVVIGVRNPTPAPSANASAVAKLNIPSANTNGGSNALSQSSSTMICSTLQPNNTIE